MCRHAVCRAQKQVPQSLDVFGWCTWDAFYWRVSAKGIVDGLQSLHDGGVPPKLLVIDDGQCSVTTAMPFSLPSHSRPIRLHRPTTMLAPTTVKLQRCNL